MKSVRRWFFLSLFFVVPAVAQQAAPAPRLDERLPANTQLFVYWHGSASVQETRGAKSLLKLWDDPEFAPAREAIFEEILGQRTGSTPFAFTREVVLSLMDNQAVFGVASLDPVSKPSGAGTTKTPQPDRSFLIYDATGKLPILRAALQAAPGVLARHLHLSVTGWWKQPDGIYFDGFVE